MIRHVLLIEFKDAVSEFEIDQLVSLFRALPSTIDGVVSVEFGENNSPEHLSKNFTHAVLITFESDAARQHYLPHPEHERLKEVFVPMIQDIVVFDYTV